MHELAPLIQDLGIILGVAALVTLLFQKIRQPIVLGYLVAGIIIGPYTPAKGLISNVSDIKILSELGVIFLMFCLGLEFSFKKLKKVGFSAGFTGVFEVIFMLGVGFYAGKFLGWSFYDSLFLGAALAISSTTIIIKALEDCQLKTKRFAELVFGVLIVEDLLAILLMVGLSTVVVSGSVFSSVIALSVVKLIFFVIGWFLIGYFLVPSLFRKIMNYVNEESLTVVSIALCLLLVSVADYFHYSSALGAFIMGSILAETSLVHRIEKLIRPIKNIFAAVFFVSIGMLIDPAVIWEDWRAVLFICVVTLFGKLFTTGSAAFLTGQSIKDSLRIGFSMAQIGEFSFIIVGLGAALNVTDHSLYPIIVAVSAVTTFTTPYFINLSGCLAEKADQLIPVKTRSWMDSYSKWLERRLSYSKKKSANINIFMRFMVNAIIMAIIFHAVSFWVLPKISQWIGVVWVAQSACWVISAVLSSPFLWGVLSAYRADDIRDKKIADIPFWLRRVLVGVEALLLSRLYFESWFFVLVALCIGTAFFVLFYRHLGWAYQWLEAHLITNLSQQSVQDKRYNDLAPWDTHFVEVDIDFNSSLVGKTLGEHQLRQKFGINVVAIYRGGVLMVSPRGLESIRAFDKLILLGGMDQIQEFHSMFVKKNVFQDDVDILEKCSIKSFSLEPGHVFVGQTIQESGIREKTQGLVVGIERHGEKLLNPSSMTTFEEGDLIFVVGVESTLKEFKVSFL